MSGGRSLRLLRVDSIFGVEQDSRNTIKRIWAFRGYVCQVGWKNFGRNLTDKNFAAISS
jgi:hypothetical protein